MIDCPGILPDHRDEPNVAEILLLVLVRTDTRDPFQTLHAIGSDGNDEAAANVQLLLQGMRHLQGACGNDDGIERRCLSQHLAAVGNAHHDVGVVQLLKPAAGLKCKRPMTFNRVDVSHDPAGDRG